MLYLHTSSIQIEEKPCNENNEKIYVDDNEHKSDSLDNNLKDGFLTVLQCTNYTSPSPEDIYF